MWLYAGFAGLRVTLSLFALSLQASPFTVGLILSPLALLPTLFSVRTGRAIDRIGVRLPQLAGTGSVLCGLALAFLEPRLEALFVVSCLVGSGFMLFHQESRRRPIGFAAGLDHLADHLDLRWSTFHESAWLRSISSRPYSLVRSCQSRAEFVPVSTLAPENLTCVEPDSCGRRFRLQDLQDQPFRGNQRPELGKPLRPRFLMGLLGFACPVVGVTRICPALDLNGDLSVGTCRTLLLYQDIGVGRNGDRAPPTPRIPNGHRRRTRVDKVRLNNFPNRPCPCRLHRTIFEGRRDADDSIQRGWVLPSQLRGSGKHAHPGYRPPAKSAYVSRHVVRNLRLHDPWVGHADSVTQCVHEISLAGCDEKLVEGNLARGPGALIARIWR